MQLRKIAGMAGAAALAATTAACGAPVETSPDDAERSVAETLQGEHTFEVDPELSPVVSLEASGTWVSDDGSVDEIELPLRRGFITVQADGDRLTLQRLQLDLDDLEVGESAVTPHGGTLTEMSLLLERPAESTAAYSADDASASSRLDLRLDWSLSLPSGATLELGSPEIRDLPFEVYVTEGEDGLLHLELLMEDSGDLMKLDEIVKVTAFRAAVEAVAR